MRPVVLDCETFFDKDYTLSKLSTEAYVRDQRFEPHGAAIKWSSDEPAVWYDAVWLRENLAKLDWSDVFLVCHHAHFDGLILAHHYGVRPAKWGDTLSMARLLLGNHVSASLDSVRQHFGIANKSTPYNLFRGKHWRELDPNTQWLVAHGACDEVESIWKIFGLLARDFPLEEYEVVDATIRMFTEPVLRADTDLLARIWQNEATLKCERFQALGIEESQVQSSEQFAALLRAMNVEPETKLNGGGKPIYAFAKTDPFMESLLNDEDDDVRLLAEARIGAKSTIVQTRAATLGWMASRGGMCVYLQCYGAHTTRWSGGDSSNMQNLKKEDPEYPTHGLNLRDALLPPAGYDLCKPDLSQVECRLLSFVAGQDDVVERFRCGADPYVHVASKFYGYEVNKKDHPNERQLGKILELSCGYGSGGPKIQHTTRVKSRGRILLDEEQGIQARDAYRGTHPEVVNFWWQCNQLITQLAGGPPVDWKLGGGRLSLHVRDGRIYLPNGCPMIYKVEFHDAGNGEAYWRRKTRRGWVKIYGAALVENIIQALARVLVSRALIRLHQLGYKIVSTEHDSLWILVPQDGHETQHRATIHAEMTREPEWLPGLPLDCEVH
jgi:hypothetical protein